MRRSPVPLIVLALFTSLPIPAQQQQLSEEEKKKLFLKAREEMTTIPYTPPPSALPTPKPKPRTPAPAATPPAPSPSPAPAPATTPAPRTPAPRPAATPAPAPKVPVPLRPPDAPIVVEKPGVGESDKDDEPPPKEEGFWSRLFGGGGGNYRYLTPAVRRAIDRASIRRGRWRYIVVHNSGTRQGNAAAFEHYHRYVRRMPNGLAYHFVIGNGSSSKNGEIEIGNRWHHQLQGGHVHSDYLNNIALGICLVGDFNHGTPTQAQLDAAAELIDYLRKKVGRVAGQRAVVRPHKAINPPQWPTDCPGDDFPYHWFSKF